MMFNLYSVLSVLIIYFACFFNISYFLKVKKNVFVFLLGLVLFFLTSYFFNSYKIIFELFVLILIFYLLNKNIKDVIISIILNYIVIINLDIMIMIFLLNVNIELNDIFQVFLTVVIGIGSIFVIRTSMFLNLWKLIKSKSNECIIFFIFIMFSLIYVNVGYKNDFISVSVIVFFILILLIILVKNIVDKYLIESKYNEILDYSKIYEEYIDELRINRHEYKNTLLCIKSMLDSKEETEKFIDSILIDEINFDKILLNDVLKIKISPIKGLLYYKLSLCDEKQINYALNIDPSIDYEKINNFPIENIKNLFTVFSILLDNAIEACENTESKNLSIYIYNKNEEVIFQISNTFKGIINLEMLNKKGYSTKGKKHGYGLVLANRILNKNDRLNLETEIRDDIFIQYLKLNIK